MMQQPLSMWIEVRRLDAAVESAAKSSGAVVVDYVATPTAGPAGSAVELAIEFFVPPASQERFDRALRRELKRAARSLASVVSVVHSLPPGTLHQWRFAWQRTQTFLHNNRLNADRALIDSVLYQAAQGFREPHYS